MFIFDSNWLAPVKFDFSSVASNFEAPCLEESATEVF